MDRCARISLKSPRGAALFVLSLFTVSQAAGLVHLATGAHAFCIEHGEEIDVDSTVPAVDVQEPQHVGPRFRRGEPITARHVHAHCATIAARSIAAVGHRLPPLIIALPAAIGLALDATAAPRDARETFRVAPKASPPRA